jgi:hyperosmotically inducible protein
MNTRKPLSTSLGALVLVFGLSACEPEGDAERAGERIDDAAEKAAEAVEPEGPAERAGEKMDEATEEAGEAAEDLGDKAEEETER